MEKKTLLKETAAVWKKAIISIIKELRGTLEKVERKYFLSWLTDLTIEATSLFRFFYKQLLGFLLFIERRFLRTSRSTQDLFFYISAWKLGQQHWILWLYFIRKKSPFTPVVRDRNLEGISDCSGSSSENFWGVVALQRTLHIQLLYHFFALSGKRYNGSSFSHEWLWRNHISPAPSLSIKEYDLHTCSRFCRIGAHLAVMRTFFRLLLFMLVPRLKWLQNGKGFLSCVPCLC